MLLDISASWRLSYRPLSVSFLAALAFISMNISIAVSVVMCRWCSEADSNRQYRIRSAMVCPVSLSELNKRFSNPKRSMDSLGGADFANGAFRTASANLSEGKPNRRETAQSPSCRRMLSVDCLPFLRKTTILLFWDNREPKSKAHGERPIYRIRTDVFAIMRRFNQLS